MERYARMQNRRSLVYLLVIIWLLPGGTPLSGQEWKSGITWKVPLSVSPGPVGGSPEDAIILFDGEV